MKSQLSGSNLTKFNYNKFVICKIITEKEVQFAMSLFCESSSQLQSNEEKNIDNFTSLIFSNIMQCKGGIKLEQDTYIIQLPLNDNKLINGITTWSCSCQLHDFTIKVAFELKNVKKIIEKRLSDILNKQFKLVRITYQKPKISLIFKLSIPNNLHSSNILQKEINQINVTIIQIISRIKQLDNQQQKFQPFIDLYSMRQCFEFTRSSRFKSSKISLKLKRNKNVTQVLNLLSLGETTLNRLQSVYIEGQMRKYDEQKKKINAALEESQKSKGRAIDLSILTSIDIINVENEKIITFSNQNIQDLLSIVSTGLYTFRKEITIHKESRLESMSNQIFTDILVKKEKTEKGSNSFENQTKFLTHLKGSYHPYVAEYFCRLEEWPFKGEALYVRYYKNSINIVKQSISSDKKLRILYQIGKLITFLNYRKLCHRDLKLDNIMIDEQMNPKVIDWGSVCGMHSIENDPGALRVKDERLFSTEGYFQRYYEDVFYQAFGKNYTKQQIQKGEFFDIYSFGFIIEKVFDLKNSDLSYWLDLQMDYLSRKCREKNPSDRLNAFEIEIYLTMLRKKMKKFQQDGLSSPISSNA